LKTGQVSTFLFFGAIDALIFVTKVTAREIKIDYTVHTEYFSSKPVCDRRSEVTDLLRA
jgi:hypothetical protein